MHERCLFLGVCVHPKVPDDTSCSDSDLCDGEETCQNGSCTAGTPVTCSDDGNPCIDDVCDPATGACGIPNTASCDDGASCNGADTCNGAGVCVSEGDQCPTGRACDEITDTCVPTGDVTLIDLGSGECRPGSEVTLDLTLIPADGVAIGVIGADLAYDPEALSFVGVDSGEATSARNGTCSANLESGATLISCFTEDPDFVTVPYEEGVVAQVTFACKPVLPDEDVVIDNTPAALTATQIPAPVQPVEGADGVIGVLPCTIPGDTNLDCTVNIVELQTCIGMFLDLVPPDSCTDINDNGDIGIVELQSCIAGFLRLLPCP